MELGDSTNTTFYFYGNIFAGGGKGSVGLRVSGASDVFIIGGVASGSFAGIYLDATGHAQQITLRDVHMEAIGQHSLYAVGAVRNLLIEGRSWESAAEAANIRHEERVPNREGAHSDVAFPDARGRAENWNIRNVLLLKPGGEFRQFPTSGWKASRIAASPTSITIQASLSRAKISKPLFRTSS